MGLSDVANRISIFSLAILSAMYDYIINKFTENHTFWYDFGRRWEL